MLRYDAEVFPAFFSRTLFRSERLGEEIVKAQGGGGNVENDDDDGDDDDDDPKSERKERFFADVGQDADVFVTTFRSEARVEHFRSLKKKPRRREMTVNSRKGGTGRRR